MPRLLHFRRDQAEEPTDWEVERVQRDVAEREARRQNEHAPPLQPGRARMAEQTPTDSAATDPAVPVGPPKRVTAKGPGGQTYTIHAADVVKPMPALEAVGDELTGERVRVWWMVHAPQQPGAGRLRGMVAREGGQIHVYLNALTVACPLLRLHTLRHELEHVRRHDLDSPMGWDEHMEARCDDAANATLESALALCSRRCSPNVPALNSGACIECARTGGGCRQDPATFADLKTRVPY
jgi:hypothetical protein